MEGRKPERITRVEQAASIWNHAEQAIAGVNKLGNCQDLSQEMQDTLDDIQALAYLGYYYSLKISGCSPALSLSYGAGGSCQREAVERLSVQKTSGNCILIRLWNGTGHRY